MKQSKKSTTKEKKETSIRDEIRGLGVIIEHIDDKVSLVAEQHGDIKKDTNGIKKTLNSHTEMIGKIMIDSAIIKEDVVLSKRKLILMSSPL